MNIERSISLLFGSEVSLVIWVVPLTIVNFTGQERFTERIVLDVSVKFAPKYLLDNLTSLVYVLAKTCTISMCKGFYDQWLG